MRQVTTVWQPSATGPKLLKTYEGLPFGTSRIVFIPEFGAAELSGMTKSGSGRDEIIVKVEYTLK